MEQETPVRSCRMSWFLVQQLETKTLSIIHSVDLVQDTSSDIYLNKTITFHRDQLTLEGILLCAADNRQCIEDELKKRLDSDNPNASSIEPNFSLYDTIQLWLLLQYNRNPNCLIHTVIKKTEVPWNLNNKYVTSREILFEDGNAKRLASILHFSDSENDIMTEIQSLRNKCIQLTLEESTLNKAYKWMLVQYSDGFYNVIYSIINQDETVWNQDNYFNECVTYINGKDKSVVYQALILKKSKYIEELEIELENIKENTLICTFPLGNVTESSS